MQSVIAINVEKIHLLNLSEYFEVSSIDGNQVLLRWKGSDESVYVICELKQWGHFLGKPRFEGDNRVDIHAFLKFVRFYNNEHEGLLETNTALQEAIEKLKSDDGIYSVSCTGKCNMRVEFV